MWTLNPDAQPFDPVFTPDVPFINGYQFVGTQVDYHENQGYLLYVYQSVHNPEETIVFVPWDAETYLKVVWAALY